MILLSIIVPIYNVERYVIECLESIYLQINENIEVIIINDGSPDNSMVLVENFLNENPNLNSQFTLINQENKGLSCARNAGLKVAKGEYVCFLDSDDKLAENYIQTIVDCINQYNPDLIDFNILRSDGESIRIKTDTLSEIFKSVYWFACARVYKKDLLHGYFFIEGIYYEDIAYVPLLYIKAKKIIHLDLDLYWYRLNDQGITLKINETTNFKTVESLDIVLNHYIKLSKNNSENMIFVMIVQSLYILVTNSCKRFSFISALKIINIYSEVFQIFHTKDRMVLDALNSKMLFFMKNPKTFLIVYYFYSRFYKF